MSGNASGDLNAASEEREITDDERREIVDELVEDMGLLFRSYVSGSVSFEDLSFEMFDTLRTLNALASGDVVIEYEEIDDDLDEFEELAGEPIGDDGGSSRSRSATGVPPSPPGHKPRR